MSDEGLNILHVTPEASPFVKSGGLGDVVGSLPRALRRQGHDVRCVLPEYDQIPLKYRSRLEHLLHFRTRVVWREEYTGVNRTVQGGVPVYFIDNKEKFNRGTLYDSPDRHVQFTFFIRAVLEMLPKIDFQPDIIHCHDWQTAILPLLLEENYSSFDFYSDIKTVFTIHNLRYQGTFGPGIIDDTLGVDWDHWHSGRIRHDGMVNFMKAGIEYADKITTVSPGYAREIQTSEYGEGLDYALRMNSDDLEGIVNGISYQEFDPAEDEEIYSTYDRHNFQGKRKNRRRLKSEMGLAGENDRPLLGMVSRLVDQKGIELLEGIGSEIVDLGFQFVVLGSGRGRYENHLQLLAEKYPDMVAAAIKYDFTLARRIYAGSDFFLMPSQFEPCGLGQMISMRYGTVPVVRETGGLKDTVKPYDEEGGTGITFSEYSPKALLTALEKAAELGHDREELEKLQKRVMKKDFSWNNSAASYDELYRSLEG
ncbi:glycogen synthase GlgA [Halarsenatibacter silvermanii]|uniref:Glycogen synthase n=1 Tax=Halarsenatibacter silvermanii TaxID=321763 RepID=A0A1G9H1L4_9FIRM|nr:glycogen synthase GlgA [Halarsenatibacter silvermanii]SDL06826.1 starch synthase [Halarsenatibacter silvermanii]